MELEFLLRGEHIALDALLKATGVASSGGAAKQLIAAGEVSIDGITDSARSRKVRAGQVVRTGHWTIHVGAPAGMGAAPQSAPVHSRVGPMQLVPPFVSSSLLADGLRGAGHGVVEAAGLCELAGVGLADLQALEPSWNELPADEYLRDGGRYRRRRHACYIIEPHRPIAAVAPRPHWQPVEYNALHGGIERWFEPIASAVDTAPAWRRLLQGLAGVVSGIRQVPRWHVEAHQFRIDTSDGIGRPTPEGAHRDGVDFVAVVLVARRGIKGGETRIFDALGSSGMRFTLSEPWTLLMLDDAKVIHETTPIQPIHPAQPGWRDTLVITFRASGFQGPAA